VRCHKLRRHKNILTIIVNGCQYVYVCFSHDERDGHVRAATHASRIFANLRRKPYSTYANRPIENKTIDN
jgi:hypothetical protein